MPVYDVAAISRKRASNKKMNKLTGRLAKDLKKRGGVIRKVHHYGHRPLAYPIRRKGQKHEVGRYTRYFVQTSPQGLKEFLTTLRLDEDIIRYKPFKMKPIEMLDLYQRPPFTHTPKISEAHFDALKRTTNINYYIARTLLLQGKMTEDEIKAVGTLPIQFEPYFKSREQDLAERVFQHRDREQGNPFEHILNPRKDKSRQYRLHDDDNGSDDDGEYNNDQTRSRSRKSMFDDIDNFTELSEGGEVGPYSDDEQQANGAGNTKGKGHKSYEVLGNADFNYIDFSSDGEDDPEKQKNAV